MKYKLGLIDPPWEYNDKKNNDPAMGGITYPVLTTEQLAAIPLSNAFEKNANLLVWATMPKLIEGTVEKVIRAWGFKPITAIFVWVKLNRKASIQVLSTEDLVFISDFYSGLGHHTNSNIELIVLAKKGKGIPRIAKNVKQLIFAPLSAHSEKPQEQYDRISRLYGNDITRVELFARKQNPPPTEWDATGLDFDGVDIRDWIKQYE